MTELSYPINKVSEMYTKRVKQFGQDPRALFWKGSREQILRLEVLADIEPNWGGQSVLDIGCGFCDLFKVLNSRGYYGNYVGVDITDKVLQIAHSRYPELQIINRDILMEPLGDKYDYVMASGTFNIKFCDDMEGFCSKMLRIMFEHSIKGVTVNYLSTFVDFQQPQAHHSDPSWVLNQAKKLSKRVVLRHDYMPYEFSVYIYRDDRIRSGNVFTAYDGCRNTEEKCKNHAVSV